MTGEPEQSALDTAESVVRQSYGKLLAYLAARTGDVAGAEDALSDAFAAALVEWRAGKLPDKPEAWLLSVARRKLIDAVRRRQIRDASADHIREMTEELSAASTAETDIPDERLRLMFVCAHPAIDRAIRAPLMLQTILGLDAAAIASAFLVSPAAMGQRLVRAKAKIAEAGIPFRVPEAHELGGRLNAVLAAIYAAYSAGWVDPTGSETRLGGLAEEGIWLGRLVVALLPDEPEALGLLALMLFAEARRAARRNADGAYVPLGEQDTRLWDAAKIDEAETLLRRASASGKIGRYQIEAALQSVHSERRATGLTDWPAIVQLYEALAGLTGSPVVAVNRAVAVAEAEGARAGLAVLDEVAGLGQLAGYQPYWAARADLLARAGETDAADNAYQQAIGLEADPAARAFLLRRQGGLRSSP